MATTFGFGLRPRPSSLDSSDPEKIGRMRDFLLKKGISPDTDTSERAAALHQFEAQEYAESTKSMPYGDWAGASGLLTDIDRDKLRRSGVPKDFIKDVDDATGYRPPSQYGQHTQEDMTAQFPALGGPAPSKQELQDDVVRYEDYKKRALKSSVPAPQWKSMWALGMGMPLVIEPGTPVPLWTIHPDDAHAAGYIEKPSGYMVRAWESEHKGERLEHSVGGGIAGGYGMMTQAAGAALEGVSDLSDFANRAAGKDFGGINLRGAAEALYQGSEALQGFGARSRERGLHGVTGEVLGGVSEILAMGPMFRLLGKQALPIFEGLMAYANSNPDTEVEVPGLGVVKGRTLPTLIGTNSGIMLKSLLHWAEKGPGLVGRAKGAAAFGLPDLYHQIAEKQGIDREQLLSSMAMGGLLTHGIPRLPGRRGGGPGVLGMGKGEVPLGDLEPGRGQGKSSLDITRERIDLVDRKMGEIDGRIPVGGKLGPEAGRVEPRGEKMFDRTDEFGYPMRGRLGLGSQGKELDWLKHKRQDIAFRKDNPVRSVNSVEAIESHLTRLNGGRPLPTEGSMIRKNADLYGIALDADQMCPRSQGQRNTQAMVERATGVKLTADHVAELREYMKKIGEAVACPQCYTESHRIMGAMATKERPLGRYRPGDLQRRLSSPSGKELKSWLDVHTGLRWNANTDYKPNHLPQILRSVTDGAQMGMHGNAYVKRFDAVDILAPSRMRINISLGSDLLPNGRLVENLDIGVPWKPSMERRERYDNVGTVNIVKTLDEAWASMAHPQIDKIIGLHHSGIPLRIRDSWGALADFTGVQSDRWRSGITPDQKSLAIKEYENYCKSIGVKPLYVGREGDKHPAIGDWMHKGSMEMFFELCDRFGLTPRMTGSKTTPDFSEGRTNPNYMKFIGPECGKFGDNVREPMKADFNWDAIRRSLGNYEKYGGLELDSWYSTTGAEYMINKLRPGSRWRAPAEDAAKWGRQPMAPERAEGGLEFLPPDSPGVTGTLDGLRKTAKTRLEINDAYHEFNRRVFSEGEPRELVIQDIKARGFSVTKRLRGGYQITGKVSTAAERRRAGEPQALPNSGSKYVYGRAMDSRGSTPSRKPAFIKSEFGTLWDVVRHTYPSESRHSTNLEKDYGMPPSAATTAPQANSVARSAYWANKRGQFPKTVREAMDVILKKGVPEWSIETHWTDPVARERNSAFLKKSAEFLSSVEHVDGPLRWGTNKQSRVAGTYEKDTGVIWTNPLAQNSVQNFIHEVAHGATLRFASRMDRTNWDRLKKISDDTRDLARAANLRQYGDQDVGEYAAEHLSTPKFSWRNELLAESGRRQDLVTTLPETLAKESRAGLDMSTPVPAGNLTARKIGDNVNTQTWRIYGPGDYAIGNRVVIKRGRTDAELKQEVLDATRKEIEGTFMLGSGGKDIEAVRRAVTGASRATKEEVAKAEAYLRKLFDEQATPSRAPESPGINIGKPDRTVVQFGTTDRASLEKQGVEYLSKVGKRQEKLDAYDKANGLREIVETAEPLLDASMRAYPLPRRPAEFAEVFPGEKIFREVKEATESIKKGRQGWFETGFRWLERVGGGPVNVMKDVFYEPLKRGLDNVQKSLKAESLRMRAIANYLGLSTKTKDSAELMRWLTARQHGGERVLELSGMNELDAGKYRHSPPPEAYQKMMNWMDKQLLQTFHDVNRERIKAGNEPIEWRQDYFTFWHSATAVNSLGVNLITAPLEAINAGMDRVNRAYESDMSTRQAEMRKKSRFSKWMFQKRTGKLGPVEMDAYGVFTKYMRAAYEQVYLSEAQSIMAKLVDGTWKVDGKEWSMKEANPGLRDSLSDYLGFVATGAKPGEMPKPVFDVLNKLGRNVAVGKVGLNFKSTLNQISSNVHNWSLLGGKYFTHGVADYMKAQVDGLKHGWVEGGKWSEAKDVGDIATRRREIAFEEFMTMRPRTAWGRGWKKAGEVGMAPLQMMDMVTAEIAWRGAYQKAMDGYADGLMGITGNHQRSVDFANVIVARSQGSTQRPDLTPFQRGQFGKVASVLQNFVINEFGFVTTDLMGFKSADKGNPEHVKRAVRFMIGALLVDWFYEDVLGVPSPLQVALSPMQFIRPASEEYKKSGSVVKTAGAVLQAAGETLPIVGRGFNQYAAGGGGVAALSTVQEVAKGVRKASMADFVDAAGSVAGVPGAFAAGRGMRIQKKGGGIMDQIIGTRQEKAASAGKREYNRKTGKWETKKSSKPQKKYNRTTGRWE